MKRLAEFKKRLKWIISPKEYTVNIVDIHYDHFNSYIKTKPIIIKMNVRNGFHLLNSVKLINTYPVLSYSYKSYDGDIINRQVSSLTKISRKLKLPIRGTTLPSIDELNEIYGETLDMIFAKPYLHKAEKYMNHIFKFHEH